MCEVKNNNSLVVWSRGPMLEGLLSNRHKLKEPLPNFENRIYQGMENKVPGVQTCSGNRRVGRKLGPGTAVDYQIDAKKMVENMKPGSVIYDLASEFGGNCELTKHGEKVIFKSKKIDN